MDDHEQRNKLIEGIAAYVANEDGGAPELDDLFTRWNSLPDGPQRDLLVLAYVNASWRKRSAWDGLLQLLRHLLASGEPIPEDLKLWACAVVAGAEKAPDATRNPHFANKDSRNQRIAEMYGLLIGNGHSQGEVEEMILEAHPDMTDSNVRKIFKKLRLRERFPGSEPEQL